MSIEAILAKHGLTLSAQKATLDLSGLGRSDVVYQPQRHLKSLFKQIASFGRQGVWMMAQLSHHKPAGRELIARAAHVVCLHATTAQPMALYWFGEPVEGMNEWGSMV